MPSPLTGPSSSTKKFWFPAAQPRLLHTKKAVSITLTPSQPSCSAESRDLCPRTSPWRISTRPRGSNWTSVSLYYYHVLLSTIINHDFSGGQSRPYIYLSSILTKELQLGRVRRFLLHEDSSSLPSRKPKPPTEMNNNLVGFSMVQAILDSVDHIKDGDGGQKEDMPLPVLALC